MCIRDRFLVYASGDVSQHASPNHARASLNLIVEPGWYMLLRFQKAAVRGNYETGNQAFSMRLRFLTIRDGIDRQAPCETAAWQHRRHATLTARNRWWHPWNRWPGTSSTSDPSRGRRFRRLAKTCLSA